MLRAPHPFSSAVVAEGRFNFRTLLLWRTGVVPRSAGSTVRQPNRLQAVASKTLWSLGGQGERMSPTA